MRPSDAARLLLLAAIWGSSFLLIKLGLEGFTPIQVVEGRIVVAALVLLALLLTRGVRLPAGVWPSLVLMAVVANIIPFLLITWGEEHISSSLAAILNSTTPLFTALLANVFLHTEKLTPLRAIGILVGFAGVGVIVGGGEQGSLGGQLAVILASASYGVGFVYARRHLVGRAGTPLRLSAGQLSVAAIIFLPVAAVDAGVTPPDFGAKATLSVLALGAVGTGLAYLLYYRLIEDVGATSASFVTYLIPIFGAVLGWAILDERIGWNVVAGAALVLGGIALAEHGVRRRRAGDLETAEAPRAGP
jgi:drug/metabolite transporter (DMT)-like permease